MHRPHYSTYIVEGASVSLDLLQAAVDYSTKRTYSLLPDYKNNILPFSSVMCIQYLMFSNTIHFLELSKPYNMIFVQPLMFDLPSFAGISSHGQVEVTNISCSKTDSCRMHNLSVQ